MDVPSTEIKAKKNQQEIGPTVGIVVIVLVIIAGGIYFLILQKAHIQNSTPATEEQAQA